jgi:glyoxylase-like metal-dependent hydrolase (beta-lactamase superfamily II)
MKIGEHLYLVGSGLFGLSHEFDSSVYVVDCGGRLAVIDSGAGLEPSGLFASMRRDGLNPDAIDVLLLTHSHADHAGGAHHFRKRFGCRVHVSEREAMTLESGDEQLLGLDMAKKSGFYSPDYRYRHCTPDVRLRDGDRIECGDRSALAIEVPGHSTGSTCYLFDLPEGRALFSGDVVFAEGLILLLNCPGSSLEGYRRHVHRLSDRQVDLLLPGHGTFVLAGGQEHIDRAIDGLGRIEPPPNFL